MNQHDQRLASLREQLSAQNLDGWFIGREDMYQGEEVQAGDERLAYLCGFTGSAGYGVVLADCAALFSDGRYTLQMSQQTNPVNWTTHTLPEATLKDWLKTQPLDGCRIGVDTTLVTVTVFTMLEKAFAEVGASLVGSVTNPVDSIWQDRPGPPHPNPFRLDAAIAGTSMEQKLAQLDIALDEAGCDAVFISRVDAVNWLTNIRGHDLPCTPVTQMMALYHRENGLVLLAEPGRLASLIADDMADNMSGDLVMNASVVSLADFPGLIDPRAGYDGNAKVMIEAASIPKRLFDILDASAVQLVKAACPVTKTKARKNQAELAGTRRAHIEDGAVMVRFLHWLDAQKPGQIRETEIATALLEMRTKSPRMISPSFQTICGSGANGAIVHYRAIEGEDSVLQGDSLLLVDSGAHYNDGTTDITRTMAIGTPDDAMRHAFTAVLKGHIAVAQARFPDQTTGAQIDVLARAPLWAEGLDYAHGTGHGVGHVLQVHEGPANISKRGNQKLAPGMLLSNEPGYYKEGGWGIRIENLIVVTPPDDNGYMGFETVTFCPIDRRLIMVDMLNDRERAWMDAYHQHTQDLLIDGLQDDTAALKWLGEACAPL